MTALRTWLQNQRGFTLAELLVAAAVTGLVMAGVFVVQRGGQQAYLLGSNRVETQQNARVALDLMTRELRSATSITSIGSIPDVSFKVCDIDPLDPPAAPFAVPVPCFPPHFQAHTIRYWLSGTTLNRTVDGAPTPLIGGVQSLTLTYYDKSTALYTGTDPTKVWVIKIGVVTKTEESVAANSPGDQRATMESTVQLRLNLS